MNLDERASDMPWRLTLGAYPEAAGVRFRVWAPGAQRVDVVLVRDDREEAHQLAPCSGGYHAGLVAGCGHGTRYRYRLDEGDAYPDPASRSQPHGVHGASEVIDPDAFRWTDTAWTGIAPDDLVIYELHVGTFTANGTFDGAIEHLDDLVTLGITAIEVMPIATCAGTRNWGYDGVALYAPSAVYGGPDGFKRLVNAAHARGLAVILDVVYNHLGPEGNYLPAITSGQFMTDRHRTPWGDAVDYDGPHSGPVRDFVIQNALYWSHEYHVDGLRLDATHAIVDDSPIHVLREIATGLHALTPPRVLIAEDERNERRVVTPPAQGGLGLDAVWADDLHHQLRRLTAGDDEGYFRSYSGSIDDVVATLQRGWFFEGQVAAHHGRARGTSADGLPPSAFVHCLQNHDQVGNRAMGDRLHTVVSPGVYRALSALLLVSPYTPLLWMGQEWAASTPFCYFTDHPEPLGSVVTAGRREEFAQFTPFADPAVRDRIPDPQAEATFTRSVLRWDERAAPAHAGVLALYQALLALRRTEPALRARDRAHFTVTRIGESALALRRTAPRADSMLLVANFSGALTLPLGQCDAIDPAADARWTVALSTEDRRFGGTGCDPALGPQSLELPTPGAVLLRAVRTDAAAPMAEASDAPHTERHAS